MEPGEVIAPCIVKAMAPAFFLGRIELDFDVATDVIAIEGPLQLTTIVFMLKPFSRCVGNSC